MKADPAPSIRISICESRKPTNTPDPTVLAPKIGIAPNCSPLNQPQPVSSDPRNVFSSRLIRQLRTTYLAKIKQEEELISEAEARSPTSSTKATRARKFELAAMESMLDKFYYVLDRLDDMTGPEYDGPLSSKPIYFGPLENRYFALSTPKTQDMLRMNINGLDTQIVWLKDRMRSMPLSGPSNAFAVAKIDLLELRGQRLELEALLARTEKLLKWEAEHKHEFC